MSGLKHGDMCQPSSFTEYLDVHRILESSGVPLFRSYQQRLNQTYGEYVLYPCLKYYGHTISGITSITKREDSDNPMSVDEFINKALYGPRDTHIYKTGDSLKHKFI